MQAELTTLASYYKVKHAQHALDWDHTLPEDPLFVTSSSPPPSPEETSIKAADDSFSSSARPSLFFADSSQPSPLFVDHEVPEMFDPSDYHSYGNHTLCTRPKETATAFVNDAELKEEDPEEGPTWTSRERWGLVPACSLSGCVTKAYRFSMFTIPCQAWKVKGLRPSDKHVNVSVNGKAIETDEDVPPLYSSRSRASSSTNLDRSEDDCTASRASDRAARSVVFSPVKHEIWRPNVTAEEEYRVAQLPENGISHEEEAPQANVPLDLQVFVPWHNWFWIYQYLWSKYSTAACSQPDGREFSTSQHRKHRFWTFGSNATLGFGAFGHCSETYYWLRSVWRWSLMEVAPLVEPSTGAFGSTFEHNATTDTAGGGLFGNFGNQQQQNNLRKLRLGHLERGQRSGHLVTQAVGSRHIWITKSAAGSAFGTAQPSDLAIVFTATVWAATC
ncbi:hypothetical protein JOM56_013758 [Amanita muscaria]